MPARKAQRLVAREKHAAAHWLAGLVLTLLLAGALAACGSEPPTAPGDALPTLAPVVTRPQDPPPADTGLQPQPETASPSATAPSTAVPAGLNESDPGDLALHPEDIRLFPVPRIISGDRLTVQVLAHVPEAVAVDKVGVDIYVNGDIINAGSLSARNWEGRGEGVYEWIWDTTGRPGQHELRVVLDGQDLIQNGDEDPTNNEVVVALEVRKAGERPLEERDVTWITEATDCCSLHVLEQTAAYRDLGLLKETVGSAVSQASSRLGELPAEPLEVYFIERTIGQGGFAGTQLVVTYTDRPYIGGELYELLVHEAVHVLDRQFAPQRIKMLAEGVAVWATGGHYKQEDLQARAAALLQLNQYIPLANLVDDFYPAQHEIGYLEAGAFVDFLVDRAGWPAFREFYANTSASDGATEAAALDTNLQTYYGRSLAELESEWLASLRAMTPSETEIADLRTSIRYYETARRYQTLYDPAAYFRTAWLPQPADVQERGNTADLTRHPRAEINLTVELMLRAADEAMRSLDYNRANVLLDSVDRILNGGGESSDPLAASYARIVRTAVNFGYEPQKITLTGNTATVVATTASGFHLSTLELEQRSGDWIFLAN